MLKMHQIILFLMSKFCFRFSWEIKSVDDLFGVNNSLNRFASLFNFHSHLKWFNFGWTIARTGFLLRFLFFLLIWINCHFWSTTALLVDNGFVKNFLVYLFSFTMKSLSGSLTWARRGCSKPSKTKTFASSK